MLKNMKKSLFSTLLFAFFAVSATAQLQKGAIVLGIGSGLNGSLFSPYGGAAAPNVIGFNLYSGDGDGEDVFVVNVTPEVGYAFTQNIVAGGGVGIFHYNSENFSYTSVSVNPFARAYFPIGVPSVQFIGQVNLGVGAVRGEDGGEGYTTTQGGLGAGLALFPAPMVSINGMLGFNSFRVSGSDFGNGRTSSFGLNVGVSVYLRGAKID